MTALRPTHHLRMVAEDYPRLWQQIDALRQQRGKGLPQWPAWCFFPLAGAAALLSRGVPTPQPALLIGPAIGIVGALAAWRATQGIYRVDPEVFEALWTTPLDGELPTGLLHHLPEWCVYIACPTPRPVLGGTDVLHGWYTHLEWDANTHEQELRLLLDLETERGPALLPQALHLGAWSLGVAAQRALATSISNLRTLVPQAPPEADALAQALAASSPMLAALCQPLVSVVLYLCSVAAEIREARGTDRTPQRPQPVRTKRGERLFPPAQPTTWDVAFRLGASLRRAQQRAAAQTAPDADALAPEGPDDRGGEPAPRQRPRAHIRRAHWHTYWVGAGSRTDPSTAQARVRWLPPIPVGLPDELIPTIRPVT